MKDAYKLAYVVVDDDADDRFMLRLALQQANRLLPIFEFEDGQELIDYLTQNANDPASNKLNWLVILDVNMPRLNGLETLKRLRQHPNWSSFPVLILSTSDDPALMYACYMSGANGYITKPNSTADFVDIFDTFFAPLLTLEPG